MHLRTIPISVAVAGFACLGGPSLGTSQDAPARNRPLIAMADTFLQQPFREGARTSLLDSAFQRQDVTVNITASVTPFICYGDTATAVRAFDALLLSAYVVGNMREQLRIGRDRDQPEAGLRGVLQVYAVIRSRIANYHVPEVDAWSEALATRPFAAYADSVAHNRRAKCDKKTSRYPPGAVLEPTQP